MDRLCTSLLFELHQHRSHVVPSQRVRLALPIVQVAVKELLQTVRTVALLESLPELHCQLGVVVAVLLPDTVTPHDHQLLSSCSLDLDDVGHAGDGLFVEWDALDLLVTEVPDRPRQVEPLYPSVDYLSPCLLDPFPLLWILWLVVKRKRHTFVALPESRP